ncbi:hypothetical protein ACFLU5_03940 [Bacteroidota bacterium]
MKNIQLAMIVLLSHSLCVQAQVTMQQTLDTSNAWHIRNKMGKDSGRDYKEILPLQGLEVKEIVNWYIKGTALKKVIIDSPQIRAINSRSPDQYLSILSEFKGMDTLATSNYQDLLSKDFEYPQPGLTNIPVYSANLSEINWDQINDQLVYHQAELDQLSKSFNEVSSMKSEVTKINSIISESNSKESMINHLKSFHIENSKEVKEAEKKLTDLKRRFKRINGMKRESSPREYSIKKKNILERMLIGGSLEVNQTNILSLGISPEIEYMPCKWLGVGSGFTYGISISQSEGNVDPQQTDPRYFIYADASINKLFFRTEYESELSITENNISKNYHSYNVGIGQEVHIGNRWVCESTILYRMFQDSNRSSNSPWKLKFGLKRCLKK